MGSDQEYNARLALGNHFLQVVTVAFPTSSSVAATLRIGTVERFGW